MTQALRPYPQYRPSGISWLGDIPAHWEIKPLKTVSNVQFSNVDKLSFDEETPVKLCNYVDVYKNDYITANMDFMQATATPSEIAKFDLKQGDVLLTKDSETWDDIAVPAYVTQDLDGVICGYHLAQIRPRRELTGKYLFRAFQTSEVVCQLHVAANGVTRYGLSQGDIRGTPIYVPPIEEQQEIAAYLDRETRKIDELIFRKERFLTLLAEKRSALISHAVTRGLNPDTPTKESGVEWLGKIPAHWELKRLKDVSLLNAKTLPEDTDPNNEILYIDISGVDAEGNISEAQEFLFKDAPSRARRIVQSGDTILSTVRTYLKAIAFVDDAKSHLIVSTGFAVITPSKGLHKRYVYYFIRSDGFIGEIVAQSDGVGYPAITPTRLACLPVVIPPLEEQKRISAFLDMETSKIDRLTEKTRQHIARLQERRSALISAAVTGKIDVRSSE